MLGEDRPQSTIATTIDVFRATLYAHLHRLQADVGRLQPPVTKEFRHDE